MEALQVRSRPPLPHAAATLAPSHPSSQAAQRAADDIAAIPSRTRPPTAPPLPATHVPIDTDVNWSKFAVLEESVVHRRYLQVLRPPPPPTCSSPLLQPLSRTSQLARSTAGQFNTPTVRRTISTYA